MGIKDTVIALSAPLPSSLIKQRKQGGATIDYISWHDACDALDERAPGWSCDVAEIGVLAGRVYVKVALTIDGVTRTNIGCEDEEKSGYGDPFSNAFAMGLKRAAALFGLARGLYDKEDRTSARPQQSQPLREGEGKASSMADLVTPKQLVAIRAIANANRINAETECVEVMGCKPEELSKRGASAFIDHIKSKTNDYKLATDPVPDSTDWPTRYWPAAKAKFGNDAAAREHLKIHRGDFAKAYAELEG